MQVTEDRVKRQFQKLNETLNLNEFDICFSYFKLV